MRFLLIFHYLSRAEVARLPSSCIMLFASPCCRGSRPAREQPKQVAVAAAGAEGQEGLAEDHGDAAAAGRGGADASPSATTFAPVNAITWEDRVCWQGATGAESEHETDDENEAAGSAAAAAPAPAAEGGPAWVHADQPQATFGDAGLPPPGAAHPAFGESLQQPGGEQPQWNQLHTQPPLDAQEQALMAQPDIAAMFAQQPPVAQQPGLGGVSLDTGLPTNGMPYVPGGTDAAAQAVPLQSSQWDQQQPTANGWPTQQLGQPFEAFAAAPMPADYSDLPSELPGLGGASAAQLEALAAAESDEEEYFTMPTAPLLRLERLALFAEEEGREGQQGDRRLQTAPDMLPGALPSCPASVRRIEHWQNSRVGRCTSLVAECISCYCWLCCGVNLIWFCCSAS